MTQPLHNVDKARPPAGVVLYECTNYRNIYYVLILNEVLSLNRGIKNSFRI